MFGKTHALVYCGLTKGSIVYYSSKTTVLADLLFSKTKVPLQVVIMLNFSQLLQWQEMI